MLTIRLTRVGKKNSPAYRVVVAEKSKAVKKKFVEILGHYNPTRQPKEVVIKSDRANFWLERGAQPSDTVRNLMVDAGILSKDQKINKRYAKDKPVEESAEVSEVNAEVEEVEESATPENESAAEESESEAVTEEETQAEAE